MSQPQQTSVYGTVPPLVPGVDVVLSAVDLLRRLPGPATAAEPDGVWGYPVVDTDEHEVWLAAPRAGREAQAYRSGATVVVVRGSGTLVCGATAHDFTAGDALVVPARVPVRYSRCAEGTLTWTVLGSRAAS